MAIKYKGKIISDIYAMVEICNGRLYQARKRDDLIFAFNSADDRNDFNEIIRMLDLNILIDKITGNRIMIGV